MFLPQKFPGQEPEEKIILALHRHWFVFLNKVITFLALGLGPLILGVAFKTITHWQYDPTSLGFGVAVMVAALYYLFIWILLFGFWLDYYLDYFLVTDHRVVDVEQSGLFNRSVAELRLNRIQDVTSEVKGFFPTILHFGNVYIQTAGQQERFIFEQVAHPDLIVKQLLALTDKIDDIVEQVGITQKPPVVIQRRQQP